MVPGSDGEGAETDAGVVEAAVGHTTTVVQIATVEDHRQLHLVPNVVKVRIPKFVPFRHDAQRISVVAGVVMMRTILHNITDLVPHIVLSHGVMHTDAAPGIQQVPDQYQ